jgi:hypothetical protein
VAGAKSLLAGMLLALVGAAAALADNPTVRISRADQQKAEAALLRLKDFGVGWTGGKRTPSKLTAPNCPGFDPKESDLTVTGHAEAGFTYPHELVQLNQDNQVLVSAKAVATDFARVISPQLADCLAYELKHSDHGRVISAEVHRLPFPHLGAASAAYRGTFVLRIGGRKVTFVSDFIFIGQGRLEFSLRVVAPAALGHDLIAFEQSIAQKLVERAARGNVA